MQICLLLITEDINVSAVNEALDVTLYRRSIFLVEWLIAIDLSLSGEGPPFAGMLAVTDDISLSNNDALDENSNWK